MTSKIEIKRLYELYKKEFLNELYDTPLDFKKESNLKYNVYNKNGEPIAYFIFNFMYDIDKSPINYKKYQIHKYWNISWSWYEGVSKEDKSFIKVTSTSFKIIDDFIRSNNYPLLMGFGGLTEKHEKVYSNSNFLDRWELFLGEKYFVKWENDKVWFINKNISNKINEGTIHKMSQFQEKSYTEIFREWLYPKKSDVKGISRHSLIKEQIKRVILKQIYLR